MPLSNANFQTCVLAACLFIFFPFIATAFTGPNDTALVNLYLRQGMEHAQNDRTDSAEMLYKKAGALAKKIHFTDGYLVYTGRYASLLYNQLRYKEALAVCDDQLAVAKQAGNTRKEADAYNNIALQYQALGRLPEAAECLLKALRLAEQLDDLTIQQRFNSNLASLFYTLKNKEKSLYYARKGYEAARKLNDTTRLAWSMTNLVISETLNEMYDSAIAHCMLVINMANYVDDEMLLAAYINLGDIHMRIGKHAEGLQWLNKGQALLTPATTPDYEAHFLAGFAKGYAGLGQLAKANAYFDKLSPMIEKVLYGDELRDTYLLGAEIKEASHQLEAALAFRKKYMVVNDSLTNLATNSTIHEMETRYQTSQKEKAIAQQQLQISNQQYALQQKNKWILIGAIIILALTLVIVAGWYVQQQKRKAAEATKLNELLQARLRGEEEERSRTARELHDGIGSILSAAKMQLHAMQGAANKEGYQKAIELVENAIGEVRTISHNMAPEIVLQEGLEYAVKSFCARISHPGLEIEQYTVGEVRRLGADLELLVYRIIQEAVNNIIKHAQATQAIVQLSYAKDMLMVTIEDNGLGFDPEKVKRKGIGLHNLPARVNMLKGDYRIESRPGEGTTVSFELAIDGENKADHCTRLRK
jgi:Signal transduction histidine kinase